MSVLVWLKPDGSLHYGYPVPHRLADVICDRRRKSLTRFLPGGYKLLYRIRVHQK